MGTTFGSFEEFWAAMGRLYDQQLKQDQQIAGNASHIAQLSQQMQATDGRLDRIASMVATLAGTVAKQAEEIESHERRLGRLESRPD
jgi:ABC-type transporter Mla subunit MlaD